jgi:HD-like signal output (HDOD) protein
MDIAGQAYNATNMTNLSPPPSASAEHAIVAEIHDALEANRLDLPTLPDMAIKIQNLIDDPNVSADKVVNLLSSDPAISMYIIKAANTAALSNITPVSNLRNAISRLGYRMLRSIVMNVTMTKLFQARSPLVNQQLKALWKHSREVAAISYVLAQQQRHLKPDQAMLAGLVHDIGALPLYLYADRYHAHLEQTTLEGLIHKFSTVIGTKLLQSWNFPDELIDVVAGHENLQRTSNSNLADYVDVVTMANLQMPGSVKLVAWKNVNAAGRLGYCATDCQNFLSNHADQLAVVKGMLEIG